MAVSPQTLFGSIWSSLRGLIRNPHLRLLDFSVLVVEWLRSIFKVPARSFQDSTPQCELLMVGMSAKTYRIHNCVRKECHVLPDDPEITKQNLDACRVEAWVYTILGPHPLVAECLSASPCDGVVELAFYENGNLKQYIEKHRAHVSESKLKRWARQMIEGVAYVHSRGVRHADIRLDQWLLDGASNARISDFNASGFDPQPGLGLNGQPALGLERPSHFLPRNPEADSTVRSDLFALGSALYELVAGQSPYEGLDEEDVGLLFEKGCFPTTEGLLLGSIIAGCWQGKFMSAGEILDYGIKRMVLEEWK